MLAWGSTMVKEDEHTFRIIENSRRRKKQNSRRKNKTHEGKTKLTKEKILKHAQNLKLKIDGSGKIVSKTPTNKTSCVSSINSNLCRTPSVRMPVKPAKADLIPDNHGTIHRYSCTHKNFEEANEIEASRTCFMLC